MPRASTSEIGALLRASEAIHTPCSTIYLATGHAFKVKKAVNLGYLDFTTLAARKRACDDEVLLNAALAPTVYQEVIPIARAGNGRLVLGGGGKRLPGGARVIDYVVRMRRLPAAGMLTAILERRGLTDREVEALVSRLVAFHRAAASGESVSRHATPAAIRRELRGNLRQIAPMARGSRATVPAWLRGRLLRWMGEELGRRASLLARRVRARRIREGHGDLHAGNICFDPASRSRANPTGLVIYDRLEFRDDFRCRDVAAELACLASTFDARGHHELADRVVREYAARASDRDLLRLQPLYRAHYAAVRAKVHAVRASQRDTGKPERRMEVDAARRFMRLAVGYTLPACLIITCGLPGSGKSVASRALAVPLRASIHRADEVRKALAGLGPTDRGGPDLYTAAMSRRTYRELLKRCDADLRAGRSAIADATFREAQLRAPFVALARRRRCPVVIIHCHAGDAQTRRRLAARTAAAADASDADLAVYLRMRAAFEPPRASEAPVAKLAPRVPSGALADGVLRALVAGASRARGRRR